MEKPIKMDDLGVPLFLETSISSWKMDINYIPYCPTVWQFLKLMIFWFSDFQGGIGMLVPWRVRLSRVPGIDMNCCHWSSRVQGCKMKSEGRSRKVENNWISLNLVDGSETCSEDSTEYYNRKARWCPYPCVPGSKLPLFPYNRGWSSTQ